MDESVEDESDEIIEDDSDEEEELDYEKYFISDNISELDMHPFRSQKCTHTFVNQTELSDHVEEQHVQKEKIRKEILFPEKCRQCKKFLNTIRDLQYHYLDIYTCVTTLSDYRAQVIPRWLSAEEYFFIV